MTSAYVEYFLAKVWGDGSRSNLLCSTPNVVSLTTDAKLNAVATYDLQLNLSDPLTAGITKGSYVDVWGGRVAGSQQLLYSGYISQITAQPGSQSIYDMNIDDALIALTEFRCPDGMVLNYPHYKNILDCLNGIKDRVSPGNQGMLPPGWTAVWLDPWWSFKMTGSIASMSAGGPSSSIVTVNTSGDHNLIPGTKILVKNVAASGYNGTWLVLATPSSTQFTYKANPHLGDSGSIASAEIDVVKGGSTAPGKGDSWATALETSLVNLQTLASHYGFSFRSRPGSTRASGVIEIGPLGDDSGLTVSGGEPLRQQIAAQTGISFPRPNMGQAQLLGLAATSDEQLTDTLDTVYNLYIGPGQGAGHDTITLQSFWPQSPDQYAAANPTVAGVSNPWQPANPGRKYYLGQTVTNWDDATYTLCAFKRNESNSSGVSPWEFGVIDIPSAQKYGVHEQLLQHKNRKIIDALELLSACIGNVAYNKDPVPSMQLVTLHPRTSATAIPHAVKPGQRITCNYAGQISSYIEDTNPASSTYGLLIPDGTYTYLQWPTTTDPRLIHQQQTVKEVQETYNSGGHSVVYTMGRAQYKFGLFADQLAADVQDSLYGTPDAKHSFVKKHFGGNISFLFSQNPDAWDDVGNGQAVIQPGGWCVSDVPDDRFFGDHTEVKFSVSIQDNQQYVDFIIGKPVWNLRTLTGVPYGFLRLAMYGSLKRNGFHYYNGSGDPNNASAVGWTPHTRSTKLSAGTYEMTVTWSKGMFRAHLSSPNGSIDSHRLFAQWQDKSGQMAYDSTKGAIGWVVNQGSIAAAISHVSLHPWRYRHKRAHG